MRDAVDRATWHTLISFLAFAFVIGSAVFIIRGGWRVGSAVGQASFGGGPSDEAITLYISEAQLCDSYFREPFETCLVVTYSLRLVSFSTHEATRIGVSAATIADRLRNMGIAPKDIAVIVHNHFSPSPFTDADRATYRYLVARGFAGAFGIWYTATSTFVGIER